jgi:hypothetical protein
MVVIGEIYMKINGKKSSRENLDYRKKNWSWGNRSS